MSKYDIDPKTGCIKFSPSKEEKNFLDLRRDIKNIKEDINQLKTELDEIKILLNSIIDILQEV
jgi:DNA-binding transcriptional regulator GbsR (MarR family)